mmetsp:Transcript_54406/g.115562  ORF Transcript_54406/g.115562 Transcript_54406/m.115562 type:complete len:253 (-) Transcript_54406:142-900(-)
MPMHVPAKILRPHHGSEMKQRAEEQWSLVHHPRVPHELLRREARYRQHAQPPVLDLRQLHPRPALLVGGVEPQRIPSVISGEVVGVLVRVAGDPDPLEVDGGGQPDAESPEERRHVLHPAVEQRRNPVGAVHHGGQVQAEVLVDQFRDGTIEELAQGPAGGGEHRQPRVLHLRLAVVEEFFGGGGQVEGVEADVAGVLSGEVLRAAGEGDGLGKSRRLGFGGCRHGERRQSRRRHSRWHNRVRHCWGGYCGA